MHSGKKACDVEVGMLFITPLRRSRDHAQAQAQAVNIVKYGAYKYLETADLFAYSSFDRNLVIKIASFSKDRPFTN